MLTLLSPIQWIATGALLLRLIACVIYDLRSRQVPVLLTLLPLVLAAGWRSLQGGWQMVLLVILLVLISDLPKPSWHIPLACLGTVVILAISGSSISLSPFLATIAVWLAWETGATGGADAKIIITLVLFFADGWLFVPIVLVGGVQGLIALFSKQKAIPYTVAISLGTAAWMGLSVIR